MGQEEKARYLSAYRALETPTPETVYPILLGYIRERLLLPPALCPGDGLLALCDASLRHILDMKRKGIHIGDISRSCGGASSVISKKVLLLKAVQEDFGISMTPVEFAETSTVRQLAELICVNGSSISSMLADQMPDVFSEPEFDVFRIRKDFPALAESVHGHPLIYLDNAATVQMPRAVMDAVAGIEFARGGAHRGMHTLSRHCTDAYEAARKTCAAFLGAVPEQIVFTAGATDGINQAADAFCRRDKRGVVATQLEHHSNLLPWQQLCRAQGRPFRLCPVLPDGSLDIASADKLLTADIGLLAVSHCSNVTGMVNPVNELCAMAHSRGISVLVDGAQSVCHMIIDVTDMDCDFFVCSGHKLGAPYGTGLLYCKRPIPPVRFGGGMVDMAYDHAAIFSEFPLSSEAGTPNVSGAAGLAAAIEYRQTLPPAWQDYEKTLLGYAAENLSKISGLAMLGGKESLGCLSFTIDGCNAFDVAMLLDQQGIALRSGHLCAQPFLRGMGLQSVLRISPCFYNTREELNVLFRCLQEVLALAR